MNEYNIADIFDAILKEETIKEINNNIVRILSLERVIDSLTVLSGDKIMEHVEDTTRPLMKRVENFANKVCGHVTVFDTKDYHIEGISEEFRDLMSPFIMASMIERSSRHFEDKRKHNLNIRRYYKVMDY